MRAYAVTLVSSDPGALAAAIIFSIILPFAYVGWMSWLLWNHLLSEKRRPKAVFVHNEDANEATEKVVHGSGLLGDTTEKQGLSNCIRSIWSRAWKAISLPCQKILYYIFGFGHLPKGEWLSTEHDSVDGKFVSRYGPLFSSSRGPPVSRRLMEIDAENAVRASQFGPTFSTTKGIYVSRRHMERRSGNAAQTSRYERMIEDSRPFSAVIAQAHMIILALIMASQSATSGTAERAVLGILMGFVLIYWIYLRVALPEAGDWELVWKGLSCFIDGATFICLIILLAVPPTNVIVIVNIGWAMLFLQLSGFLIDALVPVYGTTVELGKAAYYAVRHSRVSA